MWSTISVGIFCITILVLGLRTLSLISISYKLKQTTFLKQVKYVEDTRLKIEEPVRPITLNDEMVQEIAAIKTQLTGLSMAKGIRNR